MTLFFPPVSPLRVQFPVDATRPSIVSIYRPTRKGLKLVRAVLPFKAVGTRTKSTKGKR